MAEEKARIGIMGGTFDPIHVGHLVTAEAVREAYGLAKVVFIPAANPPHKQDRAITAANHRLAMTRLAVQSNPYFQVSALEMERKGLSYTLDTVYELVQRFGASCIFYFITGADEIRDLPQWYHIEKLLQLCHFIAATRQGCRPDIKNVQQHLGALGYERVHQLTTPELEISSTDIRVRVRSGRSIKYIVPAAVEEYIYKEGLYK